MALRDRILEAGVRRSKIQWLTKEGKGTILPSVPRLPTLGDQPVNIAKSCL
jgi:hypothetical protein